MPDTRAHHGPHPEDQQLFAPEAWPRMQAAVMDYSWLLTRDYAAPSGLKIVGDRYELNQRQRMAVARSSCSDQAMEARGERRVLPEDMAGSIVSIDGFNLFTTIEVALGGGVVLVARDECFRDIAGVHGTYRKVDETAPSILLAGKALSSLRVSEAVWYLDKPVGNSGRLRSMLLKTAREQRWNWQIELVTNPDSVLIEAQSVVASADSVILDRCGKWVNLARHVITTHVLEARVVPMAPKSG
jgi:hypothetical protein